MKIQQDLGALARVWKFLPSEMHGRGGSSSTCSADPEQCSRREGVVAPVGSRTLWSPAAPSTKLVQTAPSAPPLHH